MKLKVALVFTILFKTNYHGPTADLARKSLRTNKIVLRKTQSISLFKMTNFENLPNEVLMKIFSFLNIIDVTHVAQVSKKLRNFCNDEDVIQKFVEKINLYNKKVPTTFLEKILDYGCKYLSLNTACLEAKNVKNNGKIMLKRPCQLKYLDVSDCGGNKKFLLESLLESCNTLEKLALQNGLQDVKGSPINYGKLFLQNAQTLQVKSK